jgi:hypothetical protein
MRRFTWLCLFVTVFAISACQNGEIVGSDASGAADGSAIDTAVEDSNADDVIATDTTLEDGTTPTDVASNDVEADATGADTDVVEGPKGHYECNQELTGLSSELVLKGVWAGETDSIVAVGNNGVVARLREGKWSALEYEADVDLLNEVSGVSAEDLWAVGRDGLLLHITADAAQLHPSSGKFPTFWGTEMVASNEAYAVGLGGMVTKFDGMDWVQTAKPSVNNNYWTGVAGSGENMIAVGQFGTVGRVMGSYVQTMASPTNMNLNDIHSADGQTFYAVGNFGTVLKGGIDGLTVVNVPTNANLYGVWMSSSDSVYVVGDSGTLLHYNGTTWSPLDSATPFGLRTIWVDAAGQATISGSQGVLIEGSVLTGFTNVGKLFDGGELTTSFGFSTGQVFLAGNDAKVFQKQGAAWPEVPTPSTLYIRDMWGASASDVWAVGWAGLVLHWDGTAWTQVTVPSTDQLESIWGNAANDIYAVGSNGALLHFDGSSWSKTESSTIENLRCAFALSPNDVWLGGNKGVLMHWDGFSWATHNITPKKYADGSEGLGKTRSTESGVPRRTMYGP